MEEPMAAAKGYPATLSNDHDEAARQLRSVSQAALAARCLNLENMLAENIRVNTALMAERAELTEKLENATMMLTARSTELDRSQKIAAEMSATVVTSRDDNRDLRDQVRHLRGNVDDLKSRLAHSKFGVARLEGTLERVREGDRLRLVAMGKLPAEPPGRTMADVVSGINRQRDDVDWVTF
jgi:chromosome segregation ATPase